MQAIKLFVLVILTFFVAVNPTPTQAEETLKPYILVENNYLTLEQAVASLRNKLSGFDIVGQYSPYLGVTIIAITSPDLKEAAVKTINGGFGAVIRVSATMTNGIVQTAYVNPEYLANIYRMEDLSATAAALRSALGEGQPFGSVNGLTAKKLRKYHYMMAMPYFDDTDELATYKSHQAAIDSVEENLKNAVAGSVRVYRVDLPGGNISVFGVGLTEGDGADSAVMSVTDQGELKHSPHLPYELLVSADKVLALRGRFRIALSFPDLTMGTFMKIRSAPGAIKTSLKAIAQPPGDSTDQ